MHGASITYMVTCMFAYLYNSLIDTSVMMLTSPNDYIILFYFLVIVVDENQLTPVTTKQDCWLNALKLSATDRERLLTRRELTDSIMNASQIILQSQFPDCYGFQDVNLGTLLSFCPVSLKNSDVAVQILHTG